MKPKTDVSLQGPAATESLPGTNELSDEQLEDIAGGGNYILGGLAPNITIS
jgi:hypothetical protein